MVQCILKRLGPKFVGRLLPNEPMSRHTSFRVGGPADLYATPRHTQALSALVRSAAEAGVPLFVLGAGANILVSDNGIRGLVVDLSAFDYCVVRGTYIAAGAGSSMSCVSARAAAHGLSGLEFIYSMPGSVGGSVWMNARCYGVSIGDRVTYVDVVAEDGRLDRVHPQETEFAYKVSPFQTRRSVIVEVGFALEPGDPEKIRTDMERNRTDRAAKGHFDAPSAGSVFKNNRMFGRPTGMIVDSLGLKGLKRGGAEISRRHANMIVNTGNATAADIHGLMDHVQRTVKRELGLDLEREVILVGEWDTGDGEKDE